MSAATEQISLYIYIKQRITSLTFIDLSYSVKCGCGLLWYKCSTHHLLQGGAATKRAREQCEAVNERGEELVRESCQNASGKCADEVTDDARDAYSLRVFNLNPVTG